MQRCRGSVSKSMLGMFMLAGMLGGAGNVQAGGPPPLPHFQCYLIPRGAQENPPHVVGLTDQFGEHAVVVDRAEFLCAPVDKVILQGQDFGTPQGADHLKCYRIGVNEDTLVPPDIVDLSNQFGVQQNVPVGVSRMLCVPTLKQIPE